MSDIKILKDEQSVNLVTVSPLKKNPINVYLRGTNILKHGSTKLGLVANNLFTVNNFIFVCFSDHSLIYLDQGESIVQF